MRKILVMVAVVLGLAAVGVAVLAVLPDRRGLPAGTQAALDAYLLSKNESASPAWQVARADRASIPSQFTMELGTITFGDSVFYQTDQGYQQDKAVANVQLTSPWPITDKRPLPFPPEELWCVRLEPEAGAQATGYGVVFVGLHQDIHNADWVVHEALGGAFSDESHSLAARIGCVLESGR